MLVLTRRMNESVMIGQNVEVIVLEVNKNQVSLGINAPLCIPVHRLEVFNRIHKVKARAANDASLQECRTHE